MKILIIVLITINLIACKKTKDFIINKEELSIQNYKLNSNVSEYPELIEYKILDGYIYYKNKNIKLSRLIVKTPLNSNIIKNIEYVNNDQNCIENIKNESKSFDINYMDEAKNFLEIEIGTKELVYDEYYINMQCYNENMHILMTSEKTKTEKENFILNKLIEEKITNET